jgi:hypothetical protein
VVNVNSKFYFEIFLRKRGWFSAQEKVIVLILQFEDTQPYLKYLWPEVFQFGFFALALEIWIYTEKFLGIWCKPKCENHLYLVYTL